MARTSAQAPPLAPVRRRPRRSKGELREEQILDVARELLATRPIEAVTIDEIASAAGLSRTSFYFYFPTKQAVLAALMEQVSQDFARTHGWLAASGPAPDELREQVQAVALIWQRNGPVVASITRSFDGHGYPPLEEFAQRAHRRFIDGLAAKIERDRAAGLAPAGIGAVTLAEMVFDMREGHLARAVTGPPQALGPAVDDIVEAVLRLIYGRHAAPSGPADRDAG